MFEVLVCSFWVMVGFFLMTTIVDQGLSSVHMFLHALVIADPWRLGGWSQTVGKHFWRLLGTFFLLAFSHRLPPFECAVAMCRFKLSFRFPLTCFGQCGQIVHTLTCRCWRCRSRSCRVLKRWSHSVHTQSFRWYLS